MSVNRRLLACTFGLWIALGATIPGVCDALTLNQSGYTATVLATLPSPTVYPDIEVDPAGNLYLPHGADGIPKVTPGGVISVWSTAQVWDLALLSSGLGYGAGAALCDCIEQIQPGGSFAPLHQDSLQWAWVALTNTDTLYAIGYSAATGETKGLYRIDRNTGQPTLIVSGGPAPGGLFESLDAGSDGKLYAVGSLDPGFTAWRLFRLDGSQWTVVATVTGGGLKAGPSGAFFVVSGYSAGVPGKLQLVDPTSGTSTVFATGTTATEFGSVGYNPTTGTIYVTDNGKIWAITKNPTPVQTESWGALKAHYR